MSAVYSLFWVGTAVATYYYVHQYATIIPMYFSLTTIGTVVSAKRLIT